MEDADDIAKRIASRAKNAIEEGSWGYYKNFGTWNYEGTVYIRTVRPFLLFIFGPFDSFSVSGLGKAFEGKS